mmetsp:Transcript_4946/g.12313  ORF Transcript_4946/g.12313 Transcript_4946/m.12313 type:complete len:82 (-) Transcript_4946:168-413(-)
MVITLTNRQLCRHILRAAKRFPSKNREGLYNEIRAEFRRNHGVTDEAQKQKLRESMERGLAELDKYVKLVQNPSTKWTLDV